MQLRPYQVQAVEEIASLYAKGEKKVLLHLATGGGKTTIFSHVIKRAVDKGSKVVFLVKGKQLVDNASQRLFQMGVDHGCRQAKHWNHKPKHPVQVCSIDTVHRRKDYPEANLVVIDEAHMACSPSYLSVLEHYQDTYLLGVTATPHMKRGLRHIANEVVYPISINELIDQGYLVKPRYFAPSSVDLSGVETDYRTGDFNAKQLADAMDSQIAIYGDVVSSYTKFLNGLPAIGFAVNKEHSRELCDRFNKAGYNAVHVEDSTSMKRREEIIGGLKDGSVNVVFNVGIFCVGVDIPCLRGVISVRPTQSYNLWIQQVGRGTRPYEGKDSFVVLDHAANTIRHGFIEDEQPCNLDGKPKRNIETDGLFIMSCKSCYGVFEWRETARVCPHCNHDHKAERVAPERNTTEDNSYELQEVIDVESFEEMKIVNRLMSTAVMRGYKSGWIYFQLKEECGESKARKIWNKNKNKIAQRIAEESALSHFS